MNDKCCALVETSSGFSVCFYIEQQIGRAHV